LLSIFRVIAFKIIIQRMKHFAFLLFLAVSFSTVAQIGQLPINRVSQMPDLPSPYVMRNWKDVAIKYDQFIYVTPHTGTHFPLIGTRTPFNYPTLTPIALDTYVGSPSATQAEGINIIPSIVSATLVGINKSSQGGINWVEKTKEFYNKTNGQLVYLNGANSTSGGDWWYDVMPNIFFYQLYSQYPSISDYDEQFTSVAERWLKAVQTMGGNATPWTVPNMNYRAWNLMTMTGNTDNVLEPEAAGGIGWLLYHAYLETGEKKYLDGAQQSLEFLSGLTSNPSYELQLPYGAFIAAKINAEQGTSYNISKILNWCFDRGPLRGWGAIKGQWDGKDVSGLIGEANDTGNDYAFALNGFQQAGALVPLIKYDKRFTRDLAKWTLNVANASRFFYRPYPTNQDDLAWSTTNDPDAVIAYEALKERDSHNSNIPLNATGDAKRNGWAATNLGLYGSSSVGYLAAVVATTDVEGILLLDVNKTDFFLEDAYPTYVLYNPHATDKVVTLTLPAGSHDVYDAISETTLVTGASGITTITVKADEAVLVTYVPAGTTLTPDEGKLYANSKVIDYHYGYDFTPDVRIKSLAVNNTNVEFGQQTTVFLTVENAAGDASYSWHDDEGSEGTFTTPAFTWTAPAIPGENVLVVEVTSGGKLLTDSITFTVVESIPEPPIISSITTENIWQVTGSQVVFTCAVTDDEDGINDLDFEWSFSGGTFISQTGGSMTWQVPAAEGVYLITCDVTDQDELTTSETFPVLVKQTGIGETPAFAYYPLDGNVFDYSGNDRDAEMLDVDETTDARGEIDKAYLFNSGSDIISVDNDASLNFQNMITLSFWVKLTGLTEESFILSHGSWEQRWKVSVTPTGRLRWTVKTGSATRDLDSTFPLSINQFYHVTVVFSGYSMELYMDGDLDAFIAHSGSMGTTSNALTFGRKDEGEASYYLRGVIDEVRIYNAIVPPDEILTLKEKWNETVTGVEADLEKIQVYPNPAEKNFFLRNTNLAALRSMYLYDVSGRSVAFEASQIQDEVKVSVKSPITGVAILRLQSGKGVYHRKIIFK
jgi:hypothetical protein